nr:MAG TPA: hypothetical protein [Caudoviricetes sp.]
MLSNKTILSIKNAPTLRQQDRGNAYSIYRQTNTITLYLYIL